MRRGWALTEDILILLARMTQEFKGFRRQEIRWKVALGKGRSEMTGDQLKMAVSPTECRQY